MKLKLGLFLLVNSIFLYGQDFGTVHDNLIFTKGQESIRRNMIDGNGASASNQFVDYLGETNYDDNKGILIGTSSSLEGNSDIYGGISLGYIKTKSDKNELENKTRSYGFSYSIGYKYDNNIFLGNFGYTQNKNLNLTENYKYKSKHYRMGGEYGKFFDYEGVLLYPHINMNWQNSIVKAYKDVKKTDEKYFYTGAGLSLNYTYKKFLTYTDFTYNYDAKNRKVKNNYSVWNAGIGYHLDMDFLMNVGFKKIFDRDSHFNLGTIGVSYNF